MKGKTWGKGEYGKRTRRRPVIVMLARKSHLVEERHPNRFDFPILPELFLKDTYNLFHSVTTCGTSGGLVSLLFSVIHLILCCKFFQTCHYPQNLISPCVNIKSTITCLNKLTYRYRLKVNEMEIIQCNRNLTLLLKPKPKSRWRTWSRVLISDKVVWLV